MEQSQLIAHCGTNKLTREQLRDVATPEGSATHQPLPHHRFVDGLIESLNFRQISVVRDEYAVSADGMKMFGVLDLETTFNGCRFSIGVRNANDKSMRLALTVGYRVLVCDNMAFIGEFTPVLAKHTKHMSLADTLSIGVDRIQRNFEPIRKQVESWKATRLADEAAKLTIVRTANSNFDGHCGLSRLWEEFEFLNDDLVVILNRFLRGPKHIESHAHRLATMRRNTRREFMLGNCTCFAFLICPARCPEQNAPRLPAEGMGEYSGRYRKSRGIFRNVEGLNYKLRIRGVAISPRTDLNTHFPVVWPGFCIVIGKHGKCGRRLQLGSVMHRKRVGAIAKAACECHLGARPFA